MTEKLPACICTGLCFSTDQELALLHDKRHHPSCPLHYTELHPRLFYLDDKEKIFIRGPINFSEILDAMADRETKILYVSRYDCTDDFFYSLSEG